MSKVVMYLPERVSRALELLAQQEYREVRAQAVVIIQQELERRGLLPIENRECGPVEQSDKPS